MQIKENEEKKILDIKLEQKALKSLWMREIKRNRLEASYLKFSFLLQIRCGCKIGTHN